MEFVSAYLVNDVFQEAFNWRTYVHYDAIYISLLTLLTQYAEN